MKNEKLVDYISSTTSTLNLGVLSSIQLLQTISCRKIAEHIMSGSDPDNVQIFYCKNHKVHISGVHNFFFEKRLNLLIFDFDF
jgi:hypothetical protein